MGCFCHAATASLALQLPKLDVSASLDLNVNMPGANIAMALAAWLASRGQPSPLWQPDPAWATLQLPMPRMSMSAIATISALVQLRAEVLAQFGIDLLVPAQANAMVRIVATLNARLSAMASLSASFDPAGLVQLANLNAAIDQIQLALKASLFAPPASLTMALSMPGGIPIAQWGSLLRPLRMLAPLIAASLQLNASVSETAQLAAALKVLARISLPAIPAPALALAMNLSAALSASASLQASLGLAPLKLGLPAIQAQVQVKLAAVMATLSARLGLNLSLPAGLAGPSLAAELQALLAAVLAMLPKLPVSPGNLATSAVVQLSLQAQALASLNWQVPTNLPAIPIAMATCSLAAQMQAALSIQAVLPAPCGSGCDAAALLRAAAAVA